MLRYDHRGLGVLGLIIVVFACVVLALAGVAWYLIARTGGVQNFARQGAPARDAGITPVGIAVANRTMFDVQEVLSIDDPWFGNPQAKLTIVQFGDFQCEHTRDAFPIMREVMTKFKNDIRFVYRDFPIASHPEAAQAAEAEQCAWAQSRQKFWAFYDKLFQNQDNFSLDALAGYAASVGLRNDELRACIEDHRYQKEVEQDLRAGVDLGVPGTPTYFIVYEGRVLQRLPGVHPFGFWKELIETVTKTTAGK